MPELFNRNNVVLDELYLKIGDTALSLDKIEAVKLIYLNSAKHDQLLKYSGYAWFGMALIPVAAVFIGFWLSLIGTLALCGYFWHDFRTKASDEPQIKLVQVHTAMRNYNAYSTKSDGKAKEFLEGLRQAIELARSSGR